MKAETCALPVQCSKCGAVFDLSYDLSQGESMPHIEEVVRAIRAGYVQLPLLCWNCRS